MLTYVVDGGGGDDEAVVADMSHLGHRQDLVLSRGGRDGQSRAAARVLPELPGRRLLISRGAGLGSNGIELSGPSNLEKWIPSRNCRKKHSLFSTFR